MDPVPSRKRTACMAVFAVVGAVLATYIACDAWADLKRPDVIGFIFIGAVIGGYFARVIYDIIHEDPRPKPRK